MLIPMIRSDLSNRLIHLTKGSDEEAASTLAIILKQRTLRGGTGNIKSKDKCVCFSEAPIGQLGYVLANSAHCKMRYRPFGIMVSKDWLFDKGGRPVIYQPDSDFELLEETQRYRHARYEPGVVDYSWEREWRIRMDELPLDGKDVTVVLPNRAWEERVLEPHVGAVWRRASSGPMPSNLIKPPWHFIVLEDLGVTIPCEPPAAKL